MKTMAYQGCRNLLGRRNYFCIGAFFIGLLMMAESATPGYAAQCDSAGLLTPQGPIIDGEQPDLVIDKPCKAEDALYMYRHVYITAGGSLTFIEPAKEAMTQDKKLIFGQDFWATSIIIENKGAILAGVDTPYGTNGKTLTFHLYGADRRINPETKQFDPKLSEGPGESCSPIQDKDQFGDCGIPLYTDSSKTTKIWESNGAGKLALPGGVNDYFYQYGNLHMDKGTDPQTGQVGHFGYKVLALSYGGTLRLRGVKGTAGTSAADIKTFVKPSEALSKAEEPIITNSGTDWARLEKFNQTGALTLDRDVRDWQQGDEILVTTTDFSPDHSEVRTLGPRAADGNGTLTEPKRITATEAFDFAHNDTAYNIEAQIGTGASAFRSALEKADGIDAGKDVPFLKTAETRAAVALLTRSIRIVSEGDTVRETFAQATTKNPNYSYGGHVVFRQGFEKLQIQGVEFKQLGQGGILGRYPVHFHLARKVPAETYIIDSSVNESMTRWYVLHSTLGVTLARNIGYKSIGHGFFLEDATETDNKLYSNLGVYARASVKSADNDRNIPGLLDAPNDFQFLRLKYHSDSEYPSVFWITNGWNAFAGNMAAGAGTCGACYWYVPAGNHDMMDSSPMMAMKWEGYAAIQASPDGPGSNSRAGFSPVKLFYKNYCSTAEHSLSITDGSPCPQVENNISAAIENPNAPRITTRDEKYEADASKMYYPRYTGTRKPAYCDITDPLKQPAECRSECKFDDPTSCAPSVFSYYTSSYNWAESNFSAIWLRSSYILLDHAFLSDVLGPGVTVVTGGDYTRSNLPVGYWGLTANSVLVGLTNKANASLLGMPQACENTGQICWVKDTKSGLPKNSVAYPLSAWGTGQRMYNVYDGPAYEDANAFINIRPSKCTGRDNCIYFDSALGVRRAQTGFKGAGDVDIAQGNGFLPNAAIGWKQSNGFYYPPAFHSRNLFFKDVDIRHYVVEPLTYPGTYRTNVDEWKKQYAASLGNTNAFQNWSDVDRQTELSDDDGSLTGFKRTISVNEDPFFRAPSQTSQCRSNVGVDASNACAGTAKATDNPATARSSPYEYVTTALYPAAGGGDSDTSWATECTSENCTGVPIYREYLTGAKGDAAVRTREWKSWLDSKCDTQRTALLDKNRPVVPWDPGTKPPENQPPLLAAFVKFDAECHPPYVRMAGIALAQRSVLTVNNAKYFIDTTPSIDFQRKTKQLGPPPPPPIEQPKKEMRNINVFEANKSYYVYFLYANKTTRQTYQIYVGDGFKKDTMFAGTKFNLATLGPQQFTAWATPWDAKVEKGILTVDVDFSKVTDADGNFDPKKISTGDTCLPRTYCTATGGKCACDTEKLGVLGKLNPNYENVCKNICENWSMTDIDCPKTGCLGFKFTMPPNFRADDRFVLPEPEEFPATVKDVNGKEVIDPITKKPALTSWSGNSLQRTDTLPDKSTNVGGCYYADDKTPKDTNTKCKVAD